ncbi:hypothetical protein [Dialister succinatiphilus]|uniref:hypothetical protein n=1 Tax=Dialister succinatiphilus TaxID=487173 RepID=UPI004026669B
MGRSNILPFSFYYKTSYTCQNKYWHNGYANRSNRSEVIANNNEARAKGARITIMETYKVKFHRISVYGDIDNIRYRVILDQDIPGYKIDTNGQIVKSTVNYIDIAPSALIAQTIRCIPNLGIIHAYLVEKNLRGTGKRIGIDAAQLQAYLTDADVTLERTEFHPGEEYTTIDGEVRTHEFDGYTTNIKDIVVTTNAESIADRVIDRIMLGGI